MAAEFTATFSGGACPARFVGHNTRQAAALNSAAIPFRHYAFPPRHERHNKRPPLRRLAIAHGILFYIRDRLQNALIGFQEHRPALTDPRRRNRSVRLLKAGQRMQSLGRKLLRCPPLQMGNDLLDPPLKRAMTR